MRGLLIKDLYSAWKVGKGLVIVYIVFALDAVITGEWPMGIMGIVLMAMLPGVLNGLDERGKWMSYLFCTPVSRKTYVKEKFSLTLICGAVSGALLIVAFLLRSAAMGQNIPKDFSVMAAVCVFVALIPSALSNVFSFRFGAIKGRVMMAVMAAICGLLSGAAATFLDDPGKFDMGSVSAFSSLILIGASVVIFALLYLVSIQVVKKREY